MLSEIKREARSKVRAHPAESACFLQTDRHRSDRIVSNLALHLLRKLQDKVSMFSTFFKAVVPAFWI